MSAFFHTVLYVPIYNLLMFFVDTLPGADLGLAVVLVTIVVRIIILPLSFAAQRTTRAMKAIEPEMAEVRERLKDDKEAQAKEVFGLYKKYRINPFASFLTVLIQLPIIFCLFWVFRSKTLFTVNPSLLYSFVHPPAVISPLFLGVFTLVGSSLILAVIAGATQMALAFYAVPAPAKNQPAGMQADFSRAMTMQMRYVFPLLMGAVAYSSGAIAVYFITSNLFGIVQEFFVRKTMGPLGAGASVAPLVP